MKKSALVLLTFLFFSGNVNAQLFDLGQLDTAVGLLNKGENKQASGILNTAISSLTGEAKGSNIVFAQKALGSLSSLSGMLPQLTKGGSPAAVIKVIQTIKGLMAAQRLKKTLLGGSLLGQGKGIASNIGFLESGLSVLDNASAVSSISKGLNAALDKSSALDGSGLQAKAAEKVVSSQLNSSLNLLEKYL